MFLEIKGLPLWFTKIDGAIMDALQEELLN